MMTSSDIIALVAIVVSGIVSILSAYISLKNNKANIESRRLEIAFEKRLDAFRDLLEAMGNFRMFIAENRELCQNGKLEDFFPELKKQYYKFFFTYQKLRFYIPPSMRQDFTDYSRFVLNFVNQKDPEQITDFGSELRNKENEITNLLQKFMEL